MRARRTASHVALFSLLLGSTANAAPEVDALVADFAKQGVSQRVIVEVNDPLSPDDIGQHRGVNDRPSREEIRTRQRDLFDRKSRVLDALSAPQIGAKAPRTLHDLPSFRLLALEVDPAHIAALAASPDVHRVHADRLARTKTSSSVPYTGAPSFRTESTSGQGLSVAVIDTPIDWSNGTFGACNQPGDPGCSVAATVNLTGDDEAYLLAHENESHGSNVAGIVLAMAPAARVIGLNVFHWNAQTHQEYSYESDEIAALQWVASNASSYGIVAANMSLGDDSPHTPCNGDALFDPIRTLYRDHGVVTVIAAGNESRANAVGSPACISLAVTVGAQLDTDLADGCGSGLQSEGQIACFSNMSGMVDLTAPGVKITAGGQSNLSGTSMASPHIAGAIALLASHLGAPAQPVSAYDLSTWLRTYTVPQPHGDLRFDRLRFDQNLAFVASADFTYFYRDSGENAFYAAPASYHDTTEVTSFDGELSGVYLNLELLHPTPENVRVKLTNPAGVTVELALPAGLSNYNGTLGRTHHAGALAPLATSSPVGTWSLDIQDITGAMKGNFLHASLFFTAACTPQCNSAACGDDSCGGSCEHCVVDDTCYSEGERDPNNACGVCKASVSTTSWFGDSETSCDDNNLCTSEDVCKSGVCTGTSKDCPDVECQTLLLCSASSGACVYENLPLGTLCSSGSCYSGECKPIFATGGASGSSGAAGGDPGGSAGFGGDAGSGGANADSSAAGLTPEGGCACRTSDRRSDPISPLAMTALAAGLGAIVRRRAARCRH